MKFRILQGQCSFGVINWPVLERRRRWSPILATFLVAIMFSVIGPVFSSSSVVKASNSMQLANSMLTVGSVTVAPGQSASLPVILNEAPNGLSGFIFELTLNDSNAAEFVSASFPDFGLSEMELTSGSNIVIRAADLNGLTIAGDTNITLATIEVLGVSSGSTQIDLQVHIIDDDDGNEIVVDVSPGLVSVANVAPNVVAGPDVISDEGQTIISAGSFSDSIIDTWTATVDYGDGGGPQPLLLDGQQFELNHTYADDGSYAVSIIVTDNEGLSGTGTAFVTVNNVAPDILPISDAVIDDGTIYVGEGSFTDPGADTWTGTVDFGDGSGVQELTLDGKSISLTHDFGGYGVYQVTVSVTDDEGGNGAESFQVEIRHVCPWLSDSPNPSLDNDADFKCEDVNGNGRLDFSDLVLLFANLDAPEVLNNAEDFDFNDNGVLDMADIITLFNMLII